MYAVRLQGSGYRDRYLDSESVFTYELGAAQLYLSLPQALQAIHIRGEVVVRKDWPTVGGTLSIVEVANAPSIIRTVL